MTENEISKLIVAAAIEVHRTLGGPGLLESVYELILARLGASWTSRRTSKTPLVPLRWTTLSGLFSSRPSGAFVGRGRDQVG